MPAVSEKQQRAMGLAYAAKKGKISKKKLSPSIQKMMESMSEEQLRDFASTKHSDIKKEASYPNSLGYVLNLILSRYE